MKRAALLLTAVACGADEPQFLTGSPSSGASSSASSTASASSSTAGGSGGNGGADPSGGGGAGGSGGGNGSSSIGGASIGGGGMGGGGGTDPVGSGGAGGLGGAGGVGGVGGSGGAAGSGGAPECLMDVDCVHAAEPDCHQGVCSDTGCVFLPKPEGTVCDDNSGQLCKAGGSCVECLKSQDCALPNSCQANVCAPPNCMNNIKDGLETDADCGGGGCPPCLVGASCDVDTDCETGTCAGVCTPNCSDNIKDGDETDVDCGGTCPKCVDDKSCGWPTDCASGFCDVGKCGLNGCSAGLLENHTADATVTVNFGAGNGQSYVPKCIKVKAGAIVTFATKAPDDFAVHPLQGGKVSGGAKVAAGSGPFAAVENTVGLLTKDYTISSAGNFPYYCDNHALGGMKGLVVVVP